MAKTPKIGGVDSFALAVLIRKVANAGATRRTTCRRVPQKRCCQPLILPTSNASCQTLYAKLTVALACPVEGKQYQGHRRFWNGRRGHINEFDVQHELNVRHLENMPGSLMRGPGSPFGFPLKPKEGR